MTVYVPSRISIYVRTNRIGMKIGNRFACQNLSEKYKYKILVRSDLLCVPHKMNEK